MRPDAVPAARAFARIDPNIGRAPVRLPSRNPALHLPIRAICPAHQGHSMLRNNFGIKTYKMRPIT
ncbi:MAG TPA: hypothetical protein VN455_02560, partial [Methanotrichaceae archaeon]|nr:hypothetical protein [Methanotrichaceae archaeon]